MRLVGQWIVAGALSLGGTTALAGSAADWIESEISQQRSIENVEEVSEQSIRLPKLSKRLVAKARKHLKKNKIVWFVRGAKSKRMARVFRDGAIERLVVQPVQKGVVVTLSTRGRAADLSSRVSIEGGPKSRIVVRGESAQVVKRAPAASSVASTKHAQPSPVVAAKSTPAVTLAEPSVEEPLKVREASAFGFMALVLLGAIGGLYGMVKWLQKRTKKSVVDVDAGIDVVAVKALGPKHRLALIEACGEKLLVSASDKEVKLLSHVGNHLVMNEPAESAEMPEQSMSDVFANLVQASSERRDDKEFNTEIVEDFEPAEFPEFVREPRSLSADLEGLVRLRERRGPQMEKSSGGVFEHLTRRYKSNEAAA